MSLIVRISVTGTSPRLKRPTEKRICELVIQNKVGHPEAPYRANYEAKFYSPTGTLVKTARIDDFDRTHGAMRLLRDVLNKECPTHLQFQEADLVRLLDGISDGLQASD